MLLPKRRSQSRKTSSLKRPILLRPLRKSRRLKQRLRKRVPAEEEDGSMEADTVMVMDMVMAADTAPDMDQDPFPRKRAAPDPDQATRRKS